MSTSPDEVPTSLEEASVAPAIGPRLHAFWEGGSGSFPLPREGSFLIGRGLGADVRIDHPSVSRAHARLGFGPGGIFVEDAGSSNGVRVAGQKIERGTKVRLATGEAVEIGAVFIVVHGFEAEEAVRGEQPAGAMERTRKLARLLAVGHVNVFIVGEAGAGKDALAVDMHRMSRRAAAPCVHLAAKSVGPNGDELVGAAGRPGVFERAAGGTLILEEPTELCGPAQSVLLHAIERREMFREGGTRAEPVDVRVFATSRVDIATARRDRRVSENLLYRLAGVTLVVPPLRERRDEIAPLARQIAAASAREMGRADVPMFAPAAIARLEALPWPGNLRELASVVERAVLLSKGRRIGTEHVEPEAGAAGDGGFDLRSHLADAEKARIVDALARTNGNQTKAAQLLGVSRRTLIDRIEEYKLPRPRK